MRKLLEILNFCYIKLINKKKVKYICAHTLISWIKIQSKNICVLRNVKCSKSQIQANGTANTITLSGEIYRCNIKIDGVGNTIQIEDKCCIYNTNIQIRGNNCKIVIGEGTTMGSGCMICMGEATCINIGVQCMLADNVDIWNTDSHPIYDVHNQKQINPSKDINIGNHVWIGKAVTILKGVSIGNDTVVGMRSIVTRNLSSNSVYAGIPTRQIKKDITWDRSYTTI